MVLMSETHKKPITGLRFGRIGKPMREASVSTCGGLFVFHHWEN